VQTEHEHSHQLEELHQYRHKCTW